MHKASFECVFRQSFFLFGLCLSLMFSTQASAQSVHLSLCIDASGSINDTEYELQLQGTRDAINSIIPIDGTVELSAVLFATNIQTVTFGGADSLVIGSQADKDTALAAFDALIVDINDGGASDGRPAGGNLTNTQGCIEQSTSILDCGGGSCPTDAITRIIDISTDGNPTESSNPDCQNNTAGQPVCQQDAEDEAQASFDAGVDVLNVIGVGDGIGVDNMAAWAFNAIVSPPVPPTPVGAQTDPPGLIEVFDPGDTDPGNGYTVDNPVIGDRGYVVLVGDFTEYQPTINAKIFNELNIVSDISVVKTADQATVSSGGTLTYTLAVTNNDAVDVPDVVVTDTLPSGVIYDDVATDAANGADICDAFGQIVTCVIPNLVGNTSIGVDVVVTVD